MPGYEASISLLRKVNSVLGTNFNTILLNKYKNGDDCIGFHKDRETGWAPNTRSAPPVAARG